MPTPPRPLDPTAEEPAFEVLKQRLAGLWGTLFPGDDDHYTSVVVPSAPVDPAGWSADYEEERLLFLLIRLRNPRARMIYVTSRPIAAPVLEYYFELLRGIPASHLRTHVHFLCAHDATPRPLALKVLERPHLLARIRAAIFDPARAYLTVGESSPSEARLALALDLPLNAADPALGRFATPSGSRGVFRRAGLDVPAGVEGVRSEAEALDAFVGLQRRKPQVRRALIRPDDGSQPVVVAYPEGAASPGALATRFKRVASVERAFFDRLGAVGAVVEEPTEDAALASAEFRINPRRQITASSTHDHLTRGPARGLWFPAVPAYRSELLQAGHRAAEVLAAEGVVSRVSVRFGVRRRDRGVSLTALGIDLGLGSVVHSVLALRFLTGGAFDAGSGTFRAPSGAPKAYRSNDRLHAQRYRGLLPEDVIDLVAAHRLRFDPLSETGVLFHAIGGVSERGTIGLTAVGEDRAEAERHYLHAVDILDRESRVP
jgi:hypothetical protein